MSMMIWLNGPFGGGKTQTAYELHRRVPNSIVCDLERIGFAIHRTLPRKLRSDFQDFDFWREATRRTLRHAATEHDGPVIVPMTIVVPDYFREIVEGLRQEGVDVRHFSLVAPREVVLRRLRGRGDFRRSWTVRQVDRCLASLQDPLFATHIETSAMTIEEVADEIGAASGVSLVPAERNPVLRQARRLYTHIRHIRILGV